MYAHLRAECALPSLDFNGNRNVSTNPSNNTLVGIAVPLSPTAQIMASKSAKCRVSNGMKRLRKEAIVTRDALQNVSCTD
jgi:hypothetical protein